MHRVGSLVLLCVVVAGSGCAVSGSQTKSRQQTMPSAAVAALDRAVAAEKDQAKMPGLLFKRGNAELEEAQRLLRENPTFQEQKQVFATYGAYFMAAINDFLTIVNRFPQSPEAPEAMYHLGVIHDYPNLASLDMALEWYHKTADQYPGTESARKSLAAIRLIENFKATQRRDTRG